MNGLVVFAKGLFNEGFPVERVRYELCNVLLGCGKQPTSKEIEDAISSASIQLSF